MAWPGTRAVLFPAFTIDYRNDAAPEISGLCQSLIKGFASLLQAQKGFTHGVPPCLIAL
jgi:hypothetical protein